MESACTGRLRWASATTRLESIPPERNAATGVSGNMRSTVCASVSRSSGRSDTSSPNVAGLGGKASKTLRRGGPALSKTNSTPGGTDQMPCTSVASPGTYAQLK
jgi:hypothetical protein